MSKTLELARHLETLHINDMYKTDFYWTWDKTDDEIDAIFTVADALRDLRERNKSTRIFDSGLGISLFRDNSTRTRFSFASACNLLGLEEQVLDEKKSQIAHGETVRETANMVSFMADVIGIRDDMYIGEGHKYQKTFMDALEEGYRDGILEQRPTLVNLQCDVDHPTQCMADMLHVIHYFGGVENLKGKKVAVVGGGNVAMDAARCSKRLGADVYVVYRRGMEELPARHEEVEHAIEEGVIFKTLNNPVQINGDEQDCVKSMTCVEMELGEPDASGRRRPVEKKGSEFELDVDAVIMSLGTTPNPLIKSTTKGLEVNKKGGIIVNEDGLTSRQGVYAGGDAVTGAATVILAMGAGKLGAKSIDEYLSNK